MPSEAATGGSLADRISKPDTNSTSKTSWADEVNSPSTAEPEPQKEAIGDDKKEEPVPQVDGATEPFNGSQLQEPEYEVEVKLADMQADPNNPLFSATSFEQLGL